MGHASVMAPLIVTAVALLLLHIGVQAISVTRELGSAWNAGPRDEGLGPKGAFAGRAERALRNYLETFPAFGIMALTLIVLGRVDGIGLAGALLWLAARFVYLPVYLAGIPYLRSLVWVVALIGLLLMVIRALV